MDEDEAFNVYFTINNWFRAVLKKYGEWPHGPAWPFKLGRGEPRALH
jgi:hypothetical protein